MYINIGWEIQMKIINFDLLLSHNYNYMQLYYAYSWLLNMIHLQLLWFVCTYVHLMIITKREVKIAIKVRNKRSALGILKVNLNSYFWQIGIKLLKLVLSCKLLYPSLVFLLFVALSIEFLFKFTPTTSCTL